MNHYLRIGVTRNTEFKSLTMEILWRNTEFKSLTMEILWRNSEFKLKSKIGGGFNMSGKHIMLLNVITRK
jgi:hypothetical protein